MADLLKPLGLAALIAVASPVLAQDAGTAPTTPDGTPLDMGTAAGPDGAPAGGPKIETYVDGTFDSWNRECLRLPEGQDGDDPCQLTQILHQPETDNTIGKITIGRLPPGNEAVAGSMIIMPLGTLLTQQLLIGVDSSAPKRYPFRFCDQVGCVAQIGFTDAEINGLKSGKIANVTIASVAAPDTPVTVPVSLKGFTAAWESLAIPPAEAAPADAPAEAPAQ